MKKRLISSALAITVLLAGIGLNAYAANTEYSDSIYDYELHTGTDGAVCAEIAYCDSNESIISVPDSLTVAGNTYKVDSLGAYSFSFASPVRVVLPDSIDNISKSAFYECGSLESVSIPESVANIGEWAFGECTSLKNVIVSADTRIGEWAFCDCTALKCADLSGVTSLGDNAFNNCENLTSVFMSSDMKSIGADAFYGCYKLTDVYFLGTQSEWNNVQIGADNEYLKKAAIHFVDNKAKDAAVLQKYITNAYSDCNLNHAEYDLNNDSKVDVFDAILLRRKSSAQL